MKHGGDRTALAREALCEPEEILDFSVNLNPLGAPGCVAEAYYRAFDKLNEYPSPYAEKLSARLAQKLGMKTERILFGNGSNQLLALIPFALRPKRALIAVPSYLEYRTVCERAGVYGYLLHAAFLLDCFSNTVCMRIVLVEKSV